MPKVKVGGQVYKIQAVLLDKDGTILDFVYTWARWGELLLARFSRELEARQLEPLVSGMLAGWGIRKNEQGAVSGYDRNGPLSMGTLEELLTLLAWEGFRRGLSWAEAKRLAARCRLEADTALEQEKAVRLLPGVLEFLENCREAGVPVGLVTSDETAAAVKHLDWLGISCYFSVCMGADQVQQSKPFPDMVEEACRRMGIRPETSVVIGDTNGDMMMGKAAGALAVGLDISGSPKGMSRGEFQEADWVIRSYSELEFLKEQVR
ncbi:HAD family hydrolase [Paenibacillus physcomitrellae]|uniref:HAD family hydrolase n=1 Tax=Paenibacillus physcomitrellae TaxID=1619311 RepID=A0ABQ1GR31_9BACL|nr:HAD family hydrolase [Paenibacillus physcomitrellae]GGA48468.1 hypothetical protein GCM10010917_37230 [Paenibacillus physcomitrellae]